MPPSPLKVWMLLYLHSNGLGRSHPNQATLKKLMGVSSETVVPRALKWLVEHNAVIKVGHKNRIGEYEKRLHSRSLVYQLTGVVFINDNWHALLFMSKEEANPILAELEKLLKLDNWEEYIPRWWNLVTGQNYP